MKVFIGRMMESFCNALYLYLYPGSAEQAIPEKVHEKLPNGSEFNEGWAIIYLVE